MTPYELYEKVRELHSVHSGVFYDTHWRISTMQRLQTAVRLIVDAPRDDTVFATGLAHVIARAYELAALCDIPHDVLEKEMYATYRRAV